ncbi:MAG: cohesin domain-containing protein [Defluviitaleaceae bacterium]|nr:cohesin domain-containing protein [Defluviitaleaceae bacterium]
MKKILTPRLKFALQTPITPLKWGIATPTLRKGLIGVAIFAGLFLVFLFVMSPQITMATAPEIYITVNDGVNPGEYEAVVSVRNNPGISAYNLGIKFDNTVLTPLSVREGNAFTSGMVFISNITGASEAEMANADVVTAVWASARDDSGDGVLYTVLFRADSGATGRTELIMYSRGANNAAGHFENFILTGATIQFSGGMLLPIIIGVIAALAVIAAVLSVIIVRKRRKNKAGLTANQ